MQHVRRAHDRLDPREPLLTIGDIVQLVSGGPPMLVVDLSFGFVTVSWLDHRARVQEDELPEPCVRRCRGLW